MKRRNFFQSILALPAVAVMPKEAPAEVEKVVEKTVYRFPEYVTCSAQMIGKFDFLTDKDELKPFVVEGVCPECGSPVGEDQNYCAYCGDHL